MYTKVYLVRHGESPKSNRNEERTRGLTDKGMKDAIVLADTMKSKDIDVIISSPYKRAILTVEKLAEVLQKKIIIEEGMNERIFSIEEKQLAECELLDLLRKSFADSSYSLEGAESNQACQDRGIGTLMNIVHKYDKKNIVIASHGLMITQLLNYFNRIYDLNFLLKMKKPAVILMKFKENELIGIHECDYL